MPNRTTTEQKTSLTERLSIAVRISGIAVFGLGIALGIFFFRLFPAAPPPSQPLVNAICNPYASVTGGGQWYEGTQHSHVEGGNGEEYMILNDSITREIAMFRQRELKWAMMGTYPHGVMQNGQYYAPPNGQCPPGHSDCFFWCPSGAGNCQTSQSTNDRTRDWLFDWNTDGWANLVEDFDGTPGPDLARSYIPQTGKWYSYEEGKTVAQANGLAWPAMTETIFLQWDKTPTEQGLPWLEGRVDTKRSDDYPDFIPLNWVEAGNGPHTNITAFDTHDVWRFRPASFPNDPDFQNPSSQVSQYYNGEYKRRDAPPADYRSIWNRAAPADQYCAEYGEHKWVYDRGGIAMIAHLDSFANSPNGEKKLEQCVINQKQYTFGGAIISGGNARWVAGNTPSWGETTREEAWDTFARDGWKHFWLFGEFDHCQDGELNSSGVIKRCVGTNFVYTDDFSRRGIVSALRRGSFYAAYGHPYAGYVNISSVDVNQATQTISVRVRNANRVTWYGPGQGRYVPAMPPAVDTGFIERDTESAGSDWTATFRFDAANLQSISEQNAQYPFQVPFIRAVAENTAVELHSNLGPIAAYTQPFFYDPGGCSNEIPGEEPPPPPPPVCANNEPIPPGEQCTCGGIPQTGPGYCCAGQWRTEQCGGGTNVPPTSTIDDPDQGATVSGTVTVRASASDSDGTVEEVDFFLDNNTTPAFTDPSSPYEWQWNTTGLPNNSQHTLKAVATDDDGATSLVVSGQNEITVTVQALQILFQDNFDDGNADGWLNVSNWLVQNTGEAGNNYLRSNFAGAGTPVLDNQSFPQLPLQITTRARRAGANTGQLGVMGYLQNENPETGYKLVYDLASYKLKLYFGDGVQNGQLIQETSVALDLTQWHVLSLTFDPVQGVTGTIRTQGATQAAATVRSTNLYPLGPGTIGLHCNNAGNALNKCLFDDVTVTQLPASPSTPPSGTAFSDDFNDGNADGWLTQTGTWEVQAGEYRSSHTNSSPRFSWVGNRTFSTLPFDLKAKVRLESGDGPIGLNAYRTDASQYHFVYIKNSGKLYLFRDTTEIATPVSLNLPVASWHWMKLSITQQGTGIKLEGRIWRDGDQVPETAQISATQSSPIAIGSIGFHCNDTSTICRYDDVSVTGPGGTTPGGGSPIFLKASPVFLKLQQVPEEKNL